MSARILVADDSVTIQKVVELTFTKENFEIVPARSGDEAIRKAREHPPDLMLIDAVMPDKSGYEVCRLVRAEPSLKNVPVILLTGTFEPFDKAEGVRVGANDFVTKPFDSQTLLTKVKQLLAVQPPPRAAAPPSPLPSVAPSAPPPAREALSSESFWNLMEMEKDDKAVSPPPPPPRPVPSPSSPAPASISLEEVTEEPEKAVPTYELPAEPATPTTETLGHVARSLGIEMDFKPVVPAAARTVPTRPTPPPPPSPAPREVAPPRPAAPPPPAPSVGGISDAVKREVTERVADTIGKEIRDLIKQKVERVVWEVVPDLAEVLIREELEKIRAEAEGKKPH